MLVPNSTKPSISSNPQPEKSSARLPLAPTNHTCSCSLLTVSEPTLQTSAKDPLAWSIFENGRLSPSFRSAKIVQRISISPDGKSVFTHDQGRHRASPSSTPQPTSSLAGSTFQTPSTLRTPTPDGKLLIANAPSGKLFVIDLATEKVVANFPIPPAVGAIAIDASGSHAYVSCPAHGSIETLNVRENKMEPPIALTTGVDGLQWIASLP